MAVDFEVVREVDRDEVDMGRGNIVMPLSSAERKMLVELLDQTLAKYETAWLKRRLGSRMG